MIVKEDENMVSPYLKIRPKMKEYGSSDKERNRNKQEKLFNIKKLLEDAKSRAFEQEVSTSKEAKQHPLP